MPWPLAACRWESDWDLRLDGCLRLQLSLFRLEWAAAIGDPDRQDKAAAQVLFDTDSADRTPYQLSSTEERLQLIERSGLAEDTKAKIRKRLEEP